MKGKKYPINCKTKDSVMSAAKTSSSPGVHGKPLMSASSGPGTKPSGHKAK